MTTLTEQSLEGLLDRVKAATGPDRELDAAIYVSMFVPRDAGRIDVLGGLVGYWPRNAPYVAAIEVPTYTASVDAALALVERLLPGCFVDHMGADVAGSIRDMRTFGWTVEVSDGLTGHQGSAPTLPLAILAALLSALKDA